MRNHFSISTRLGLRAVRIAALAGAALPAIAQAQDIGPSGDQVAQTASAATQDGTEGEIIVTGSRAAREQAIERKRALATIADVVSSDDIGKLPDFNTAEALQRLPGVSVQIDQGEPRYVVVRGIDPNLNQVTIDGNLAGIPEAEGRRVALDTIPSDLVSAIEVVKAVTPDYDANAIGGSINLVTPTAFDRPKSFTYATVRGTYNDKSEKFGFGGSATHGQRFGPDDQFGIVVAGSYLKRFIDSDLAEPTAYTTFTTAGIGSLNAPTNFILYDYRIMRERIGGIVNLDWRPNDDIRLYVRNIYNEFTDKEERDQFNIVLGAGRVLNATQVSFPNVRATRQFRQNNQTQRLYNISPGGEFRFGTAELDVNYTFAHAQEHTPVRDDLEFREPTTGAARGVVLDVSSALPDVSSIDARLYDPADYPLRRIRQRREKIDEDLNTVRADLKVKFGDAEQSFFKVGGKFIKRVKDRDNSQTQRDLVGASTLATTGAVQPPPQDFYEGRFSFGPTIDYQGVLDYYAANPQFLTLNATQTAINERSLDYHIDEKIYAGYGMVSLTTGDLTAIGGVRVERTDGAYSAFAIRTAGIVPVSFDKKYTHVLPSVHLNYRATADLLLRAAYTNTIGRPNYDATVPTFTEGASPTIGVAGNPDLKPYKSMGLDFSAEYYPGSDSIVSVGVFYKRLKNPIFTQTILNTTFAGIPLTSLSQPQNADSGKLFGVEVNVQKRFTFLPAPLDGFGVSANGTYIDSSVKVPGREAEDIPFFRQSKWIGNAALFYEKGPFEARVAVNYRSSFIENVGNATQRTTADIYQYPRTSIDTRASYKVSDAIEIFASASNINKAPLNYYQTNKNQDYSREMYSFNTDFGVSMRF